MTIQVSKTMLVKVLNHYTDKVLQEFQARLITPSTIAEMENYLSKYQHHLIQRETNLAWRIPLKLISNGKTIDVTMDEQADVEII